MVHLSRALAWLVTLIFSQVAFAQLPTNTRVPTGTAGTPSAPGTGENGALDAAAALAEQIANAQSGKAKEKAKKAVEAWKDARAAGRVLIMFTDEASGARPPRGFTWPDLPGPAVGPTEHGHLISSYRSGQTSAQYTAVADWMISKCPCATAVLILHEGVRLDQEFFGVNGDDLSGSVAAQDMSMYNQDLLNIQAARNIAACQDAGCLAELTEMEKSARTALRKANRNAIFANVSLGQTIYATPEPYPPTYR